MRSFLRHLWGRARPLAIAVLTWLGIAEPLRRLLRRGPYVERPPVAAPVLRPISVGPHNIELYRLFIDRFKGHGGRFITSAELYAEGGVDPQAAFALVRHDVDYMPENLKLVADVDVECGIRSDIHVIVDGSTYDPAEYAAEWRRLADQGFLIGLHTMAPSEADFFSHLRREIDQFSDLLGFAPTTFSIHGVCPSPPDWAARRRHFLARIGPRLDSFGFAGSHNIAGPATWIEDSGLGGQFAYLHENWLTALPVPGRVLGVLVHPDHWVSWPPRWHWDESRVVESPVLEEFIREGRQPRHHTGHPAHS